MKRFDLFRFIARLRNPALKALFDIPTHLTDREKLVLFKLSRTISNDLDSPVSVVEVGSYLGASSAFLAAGLTRETSRIFCIDTWNNDAMSDGRQDTMAAFLANTKRFSSRITPVRGWSTDTLVFETISSQVRQVDLLFIDGDHSYEGALADWKTYAPLLSRNAWVVMHDIGWAEGVQRVVAEEIQPRAARQQQLPNLWWGQLGA